MDFLAQGTIYPDVVESGLGGESATIKSHHNVGGLPDFVDFRRSWSRCATCSRMKSVRPAASWGCRNIWCTSAFPGPPCHPYHRRCDAEKVAIVQDADAIWREEVDKLPMEQRPSQYFAALTNMRSVGVMGDERTYDYAIALRAVTTTDFMTAEVTLLPTDTITTAANRITQRSTVTK